MDIEAKREHNRKVRIQRRDNGKEREYMQKVKAQTLTHYGGDKLACVRCGFTDIRALSIDHIDGSGAMERKSGHAIYFWLRTRKYPVGYQTLCMNCQFIKREEEHEYRFGSYV